MSKRSLETPPGEVVADADLLESAQDLFKNDLQRRFCLHNKQQIQGRFILHAETCGVIAAGDGVKVTAQRLIGYPIKPDEMYPMSDMVKVCIAARSEGVSVRRIGAMIYPRVKQLDPTAYPSFVTFDEVGAYLDRGRRGGSGNTAAFTYRKSPVGVVQAVRASNPYPCEYVAGLLEGGFKMLGHDVKAVEVYCHWLDTSSPCVFELSTSAHSGSHKL